MKRMVLYSIALVIALVFGLGYFGLQYDRTFRPAFEEVRREVFEGSQSRVQGQRAYLNRLRLEMARAETDRHRCALRATALHEASNSNLTEELEEWISEIEDMSC